MIVTGCIVYYGFDKNKIAYIMQDPVFPYRERTYIGGNFKAMQKIYRQDHNLKRKRIDWNILGKEG